MTGGDTLRLVALAAIWGSSFLFMRIAAPELGAVPTAWSRLFLAGIVLTAFYALGGTRLEWRRHWKSYALIGAFNAAIPFTLFSFAALHIPASLSAILNSTAPLFGAVIGALAAEERLNARRGVGLAAGFAGVVVISGVDRSGDAPLALWAIAAGLIASACYGLAAVHMKRWAGGAGPSGIAAGSLLAAGILLTPALAAEPPPAALSAQALGSLAALALLCSAFAYLLYFRLVRTIGATRTLIVTYLIPLFGVLWGMLFLGESLPPGALAGGALVLAGTVLVTRS
jgi:drug/metabolite transporter (DMT)-like permease